MTKTEKECLEAVVFFVCLPFGVLTVAAAIQAIVTG